MRGDLGITYDDDCLRLIDAFRSLGLYVGGVCITQYAGQNAADAFIKRLNTLGVRNYRHYPIAGYPSDVAHIVSDEGFGRNEYIETTHSLIVITAPGPGSGKMATCLSQLYHEHKHGVSAGYAKFETFPIWNLPLKHPVNLAYEAATADLDDVNMIDPFHLEAYGETTVNYNRDVEIFPVLRAIFERISGKCPYQSPTDMGVNMAGNCIINDEVCRQASRMEILRRYYAAQVDVARGVADACQLRKLELVMQQADVTPELCPAIAAANQKAEETDAPAGAMMHELYEQLGHYVPDYIFMPVGNGTMLLGLFLGFMEIGRLPHFVAVQSSKCAPLYEAYHEVPAEPKRATIAEAIRITQPKRLKDMVQAIKASGGDVVKVLDKDILKAQKYLSHHGVYVEMTSAAALAGAEQFFADGKPDNYKVVIPLTGNGLKR